MPEPEVAVGIVTCGRGALIARRVDGKPPWTFAGGKIEPGESAADAVVRELREETGLVVTAAHEIGRRVHPVTGRTIVYLACRPAGDLDVRVCAEHELDDVRWATLDEVRRLLPGIYEQVLAYLVQELGASPTL